jgi:plastocyanin
MRWLVRTFAVCGVLAAAAVDAADIRVDMRAGAYVPADVRGRPGDTLRFVNHDAVQHQPFVPTTGWGVNLGDVRPGGTAALPLARPGRFEIECAYHPGMRATVVVGSSAVGGAGPESVAYPVDYRTRFVQYGVIDAVHVKRVRTFYVANAVLAAAAPGRAFPEGTVLVMEVRDAELDADGQPRRDVAGRFIAGDGVVGLWVQAKAGGTWRYGQFDADGTRVSNAQLDRCAACHSTRAAQDFTYLLWTYVAAIKKP